MSGRIRKPTKAWRSNKNCKYDETLNDDLERLQLEIMGLWRCNGCQNAYPLEIKKCPKCPLTTL